MGTTAELGTTTARDPAGSPRRPAPRIRPDRTLARWAVRHGVPALYLSRSARRGDLVGRLLRDPAVRDEPYELYEQLRARGPLVSSSLGLVTTSHALVQEVLRSDRFGVGFDRAALPRVFRWALEFGDELDASGVAEPPSMLAVDPPTTPASAGWSAGRSRRGPSRPSSPWCSAPPTTSSTRSSGRAARSTWSTPTPRSCRCW